MSVEIYRHKFKHVYNINEYLSKMSLNGKKAMPSFSCSILDFNLNLNFIQIFLNFLFLF